MSIAMVQLAVPSFAGVVDFFKNATRPRVSPMAPASSATTSSSGEVAPSVRKVRVKTVMSLVSITPGSSRTLAAPTEYESTTLAPFRYSPRQCAQSRGIGPHGLPFGSSAKAGRGSAKLPSFAQPGLRSV